VTATFDRNGPQGAAHQRWLSPFSRLPALIALVAAIALAAFDVTARVSADEPAFYDPVEKQIEGWTIRVDPQLLAAENEEIAEQAFGALANHLQRVRYIVPKDRCDELQKLPIWIELHGELANMQYHPDRGWLVDHKHDPRLVRHVHIPRAAELYDPHMWAKHPYVVLHELAHAYHDQVLGFEHAEIIAAYESAKQEKLYDEVLLYTGEKVRHYGLTNHKEYFAESTEAYFGVNDFYPFVRAELQEHDPTMFTLLEQIWGRVR
jgi:dipeptidyl-peptidase-4